MYDEKPYLDQAVEILGSGGWIMIPLFILGLIAFYVAARLWVFFLRGHFRKTSMEECEAWVKDSANAKGQVGEIIRYSQDGVESLNDIQNRFAEIRTAEMPRLNQNITFLTIVVNAAPLMGLFGTIIGMIETFTMITLFGTGDPKTMASGISTALVTTWLGLMVAIPTTFMYATVNNISRGILGTIEESSTGMAAKRSEGTN